MRRGRPARRACAPPRTSTRGTCSRSSRRRLPTRASPRRTWTAWPWTWARARSPRCASGSPPRGGRGEYDAGLHRGDGTGELAILRGPAAGTLDALAKNVDEALALCARGTTPWFLGPGAVRAREAIEARYPGGTLAPGDAPGGPVADAEGPSAAAVARIGAPLLAGSRAGRMDKQG